MRTVFKILPVFLSLVLGTACSDAPTVASAPDADYELQVQGCVGDGTCLLDPVIVDPGAPLPDCDMWWSPDCGSCMTGAVIHAPGDEQDPSGCYGGGTGPGPGGGGSDPYGPGGGGTPGSPGPAPSPADDMARDTVLPNCSAINLTHWQNLYCFRRINPDSAQTRATLQALDEIAKRGPECAAIAQVGRDLLAAGRITFFVWQQGDAAGYGHANTDIQLDESFARLYGTPGSGFEKILVHEIDHVLRFEHLPGLVDETPHTGQCG